MVFPFSLPVYYCCAGAALRDPTVEQCTRPECAGWT